MKFGLRLQLAFILVSAFAVLFFLLGFALFGLEHRARVVSDVVASDVQERFVPEAPIVVTPEHFALAVKQTQSAVWKRIHSLLSFYAVLTGAVVVLLTYVFLTVWIVQPLEKLIRASEALAHGTRRVRVQARGPTEVVHLADAFNHMADELQSERERLVERLRELEKATRELRSAQDQVVQSEKLASVGRLAAGVAHEIGNPLAAILGLVELMRDGELSRAEESEFLRRIHRETERIHHIIRDLLDFSRDQSAKQTGQTGQTNQTGTANQADQPDDACTDLEQVVEEAVRLIGPQKDLDEVNIERRFEDNTPPVALQAHPLTQIVLNLLLNATDAVAGQGTITIDVRPDHDPLTNPLTNSVATDEATGPRHPSFVLLTVTDTGPGIADEARDHLFEPFFTTKPVGHGTGLGLAVCHSLVTAAGGSITASNLAGGGACFQVRLPASTSGCLDRAPRVGTEEDEIEPT